MKWSSHLLTESNLNGWTTADVEQRVFDDDVALFDEVFVENLLGNQETGNRFISAGDGKHADQRNYTRTEVIIHLKWEIFSKISGLAIVGGAHNARIACFVWLLRYSN